MRFFGNSGTAVAGQMEWETPVNSGDWRGHSSQVASAQLNSGLLTGRLPFARIGIATRKLAVFPGLVDTAGICAGGATNAPSSYDRARLVP